MDSGDEDGNSATKHVLDYYKKYSLNKELPKYFSGTSVSYLPEIKDEVENAEVVVETGVSIVITDENKDVIEVIEEPLDTSRASSVTSNRKLEWDNGADIGYDNCSDIRRLRKSSSLPLLTELKQNKVDLRRIMSNMEQQGSQSSSDSNVKVVLLPHSSSSECPSLEIDNVHSSSSSVQPEEKKIIVSSSSNVESNVLTKDIGTTSSSSDSSSKQRISQFANTLLYLKKRIGMPDAHSTPKYPEGRKSDPALISDTPVLKNAEEIIKQTVNNRIKPSTSKSEEVLPLQKLTHDDKKPISYVISLGNLAVLNRKAGKDIQDKSKGVRKERVVKYRNKKVINLAVTTPITVECVYDIHKSEEKPKDSPGQTVRKYSTVAVQTDSIPEQELIQIAHTKKENDVNQSLLFFEHSESDGTNARSTQTGSIVASKCDSFEFYKNSPEDENDLPISTIHREVSNEEAHKVLSKHPANKIQSTTVVQHQTGILRRSQKTDDLTTVPSGEISQLSSGDFCLGNVVSASRIDNLGDDIEKSISLLQKLLKSKKYDSVTKKRYIKKIVKKIMESKYLEESSTSSDLFFPKKSKLGDLLLAKHPALVNSDSSDETTKKSELKLPESSTDSTDAKVLRNTLQPNLPWGPASSEKVKLSPRGKKLVFKTFTQDFLPKQNQPSLDETSSTPEIIPTDSRETRKNCFTLTNNEFSVKHKSDDTVITRAPCEMDNTSLEKQYESTSSKSVSYENWREDKTVSEKLLEEQKVGNGNGDCFVQFAERERKYQINWISNEISHLGKLKGLLEKPALEPNVKRTTTVYTVSGECDNPNKRAKKSQHKFVIETQLGTDSTKDKCYKIGDKKYTVHRLSTRKLSPSKRTKLEMGIVDVVSGDTTTNIKVVTFCDKCKRAPCICAIKMPRLCQVCKECPCVCPSSSSKKMAIKGSEKTGVCYKCKRTIYNAPSAESMLSGKTICIDCHRASCTCMKTVCGPNSGFKESSMHERYHCYYTGEELFKISPSDQITGTFIPAIRPKSPLHHNDTKCLTFPYTAREKARKGMDIKSAKNCTDCGGAPCVCHLKKDCATSATSRNILPTQNTTEVQCGSLKKVFENCSCTSESKCQCGFVQKLIKHFDIAEIPTSILKDLIYYDKNCQTEENKPTCHCQSVGIQVDIETTHQKLQTIHASCDVQNKILQTEDCPANCNNGQVGVQTHVNTKSQLCQKSGCKLAQHTIAHYCQPSQVMRQYQETQTTLVKYSSGEERVKQGVSCAEKSTGCNDTQLKLVDCSEKKDAVVCICTGTQVDSDLFQTCSSAITSSCKCSKCKKYAKKHVKCVGKHTATSINNLEPCKSDSFESNTRYVISSKSTSAIASSCNELSESLTEETSSKTPTVICVCCKEQHTPENIVMQRSFNQHYPLCKYCVHRRPILTAHCYTGPHHVCTCYKPVRTDILQEIRNTVDELHSLDRCTCPNSGQMNNQPISHCRHCQFKLGQTNKNKNAIAYTLTLEDETPRKVKCRRKKRKPPLEEVRIKVPCSYNRKRCKDKENFCRKDSAKEKAQVCSDGDVKANCSKDDKPKIVKCRNLTLQEHLRNNRPEFIDSAEYRRQTVLASRSERELNKDEVKLRFLDENINNNKIKKRKLFTEKEMKEITKRNYKKLPEVRQKLNNVKEQKLKFADKFITDVFTRKIRGSVLKGKKTFPIDRNIVILPKM